MTKNYHKFLIIFSVFILLGGVYSYFISELKTEASLISSLNYSSNQEKSSSEKISADISFISTLSSLKTIKIDTSLFNKRSFINLKDNTVRLETVPSGRINPFAPIQIDSFGNILGYFKVLTNEPIEIKNNSAVLSGTINDINRVSAAYFEYGLTKELGKKTSQATISLIGGFILNVLDLESKKTYFYRACAKVSGLTICGEVSSFRTN